MDTKIVAQEGKTIDYYFTDKYIEVEEFRDSKKYRDFDALMEVNEKILMNKKAFIFYRENPSPDLKMHLKFQLERRVEEVMIEQFTRLSVDEFRQIKQPLNVDFRNVYDPKNEASDMEGWVGFVFGAIIVLFVLLFGMTILRSTTREKSNRIVEVLLASVKPSQLMLGKITGIGISALIHNFHIFLVVHSPRTSTDFLPIIFFQHLRGIYLGQSLLQRYSPLPVSQYWVRCEGRIREPDL
jgi:ABC-2 type transport system permease protein